MAKFMCTLISVFASLCVLASGGPLCSNPSHKELTARLITLNANEKHESFVMDPSIASESQDISPEEYQTLSNITHLYGETHCPTKPPTTGVFHSLDVRSTCPYYFVINHRPSRFPATLAEAKCRCTNCMKQSGDSLVPTINECIPIAYPVRVLEQTGKCIDGLYEYAVVWQQINVGCTCAMPNTHLHAPSTSAPDEEDDGPNMASK